MSELSFRLRMPYPLASQFASIEPGLPKADQCMRSLRLIQVTLRFLALVNVADACSRDIDLGDWWEKLIVQNTLRTVLVLLEESTKKLTDPFLGKNLASFVQTVSRHIKEVIAERNWIAHEKFHLTETEAADFIGTLGPVREAILGHSLAWLEEYALGTITHTDTHLGNSFYWRPATGDSKRGRTLELRIDSRQDRMPLARHVMLLNHNSTQLLNLRPWIRWANDDCEGDMVWLSGSGARQNFTAHYVRFDGSMIEGMMPASKEWSAKLPEKKPTTRADLIPFELPLEQRKYLLPPAASKHFGFQVEGFEPLQQIAFGDRSHSWIARRAVSGELVVAKVFTSSARSDFDAEVLTTQYVEGPGTPEVVQTIRCHDLAVLFLKYVNGSNLAVRIRGSTAIFELALSLGQILDRIHGLNIMHGDVTEENVVDGDKGVVLVDFSHAQKTTNPGNDVRAAARMLARMCGLADTSLPTAAAIATALRLRDDELETLPSDQKIYAALARAIKECWEVQTTSRGGRLVAALSGDLGQSFASGALAANTATSVETARAIDTATLAKAARTLPTPIALGIALIPDTPLRSGREAYHVVGTFLRYAVATGCLLRRGKATELAERSTVPADWITAAKRVRPELAKAYEVVDEFESQIAPRIIAGSVHTELDHAALRLLADLIREACTSLEHDELMVVARNRAVLARGASPSRWEDEPCGLADGAYLRTGMTYQSLAPLVRSRTAPSLGFAARDLVLFAGRIGRGLRFLPAFHLVGTDDNKIFGDVGAVEIHAALGGRVPT